MDHTGLWEIFSPMKVLYSACVEPVCREYGVTRTELDILLFLANNPEYDTAAEIIEIRYLVKSHVSTSIKALEEQGYLRKVYRPDNKKTAHLAICERAGMLVTAGQAAQRRFFEILCEGLSGEELAVMQHIRGHMAANIRNYLKENEK